MKYLNERKKLFMQPFTAPIHMN